MQVFIFVLIVVVCVLLALIVLIQNPKGGGLDSNFQSVNQIGGVKRTADFLEKGTWTLAISLFVLCLVSAAIHHKSTGLNNSIVPQYQEAVPQVPAPAEQGAAEMPPSSEPVQPAQSDTGN